MTALATQLTGPPIIPQSSSRIAPLERVSLPESLLDWAKTRSHRGRGHLTAT
jgi:hypothetical protein